MGSGVVLGARERLSRGQALRALTVGGAWLTFAEMERGMLTPGRAADLAVLDRDPLTAPVEALAGLDGRTTREGCGKALEPVGPTSEASMLRDKAEASPSVSELEPAEGIDDHLAALFGAALLIGVLDA